MNMVLDRMRTCGHESVTFVRDPETGLEAIVAVHDTTLGPALGGTRILDYENEEKAKTDVMRLSRGMTYKAAAADLDLGGGKAVILGDPAEIKDEELFRAYGRAVADLNGNYVTAEDMNTEVADMDIAAEETEYVVGTSDGYGDPSPVTSHGVMSGIRATLEWKYGDESLDGVTVLVQGAGKVGEPLVEDLAEAGASVKVAEPDREVAERVRDETEGEVTLVDPDEAVTEPCDVFAPCAISHLGLGDADKLREAIPDMQCDIVAGSANNALGDYDESEELVTLLEDEDILYAPDYVINAGGLILAYHEWIESGREEAYDDAEEIHDRLLSMFEEAERKDISTVEAANRYAEERFR